MANSKVVLGEQYRGSVEEGTRGRRIIGIELRVEPAHGYAQEEVFMEGLDIELPAFSPDGLNWSVTLHTTNGDVTMDTGNGQYNSRIQR